jgi:hypothetical protein
MDQDKPFVTEFLETYKCHPALWNTKINLSKNKHLRNIGIEDLLMVCQEKFKDANAAFIKQKINNLRTAFSRELNKVLESKTTGSSTDEIYVPTLWYYDLLSFTTEDESGRVGIFSLHDATEFKVSNLFRIYYFIHIICDI